MASRSSQVGVIVARYGRRLRQDALRVTGQQVGELCRIGCRAAIDAHLDYFGDMPVGSMSVASVSRTETGKPGSNPRRPLKSGHSVGPVLDGHGVRPGDGFP